MSELTIVDTSMCKCDKGVAPGILSVTSQQIVKTNGLLHATEGDKIITPFGMCAITRSPCAMALIEWQNTARHTKVNGMKYLTEKSKIRCGVGGEVSFIKSNQTFVKCIGSGGSGGGSASPRATVTSTGVATSTQINQNQAANPTSVQQQGDDTTTTAQEQQNEQDTLITAIQWHDGTSNLAINDTNYGDTIYLTAQITNPQGSTAKVIITKEDGSKFSTFKKQLKSTATIGEDGSIKISSLEIDQEWDDFKTADVSKLIATVSHHGVTTQSDVLTIKPLANVLVFFRPCNGYNGAFGMDYMRDTRLLDAMSYKDLLGTNKEKDKKEEEKEDEDDNLFTPTPKKHKKLENEAYGVVDLPWYKKLMKKDKTLTPYTNTYLAIIKGQSATLSFINEGIALEKDIVKEITLDYDSSMLHIDNPTFLIAAPVKSLGIQSDVITITCIQTFINDQIIKVMDGNRTLGQIIVVANATPRHLDIVFVNLTTNISSLGEPLTGNPTLKDRDMAQDILGQALCKVTITHADFNLTKYSKLHQKLVARYVVKKGKEFVINASTITTLEKDEKDVVLFLRKTFIEKNKKYKNFHTVFFLGDLGVLENSDNILESLKGYGEPFSKRAILFANYTPTIVAHELLHTLGAHHSFGDESDYTFRKYYTDNIMDYSAKRNQLWYWQWKRLWIWLDN